MELILSIGIFLLVFGGLAVGLLIRGRTLQTSCGGISCIPEGRCEGCPHRQKPEGTDG